MDSFGSVFAVPDYSASECAQTRSFFEAVGDDTDLAGYRHLRWPHEHHPAGCRLGPTARLSNRRRACSGGHRDPGEGLAARTVSRLATGSVVHERAR
jgi:hypothetical protein